LRVAASGGGRGGTWDWSPAADGEGFGGLQLDGAGKCSWVVLGGVIPRKTLKFVAATASIQKKIHVIMLLLNWILKPVIYTNALAEYCSY
jgi:hypothetical protein